MTVSDRATQRTRDTPPNLDRIRGRPQADHAQRVVFSTLHLVFALLPHSPRQPFAPRVSGLGCNRSDARGFVFLPVAALAGLATVVRDLTLRASAKRGAAAFLAAQEAGEQVDPLHRLFLGAGLFSFAELLHGGRVLVCGGSVGSVGSVGGRGEYGGVEVGRREKRPAPHLWARSRVRVCSPWSPMVVSVSCADQIGYGWGRYHSLQKRNRYGWGRYNSLQK